MYGRLLAISDLHVAFPENRAIAASLRPSAADDWLLVAGDVAERLEDVEWALGHLSERFAKVVWAPGHHELRTHPADPVDLRGEHRYRRLVELCRALGVVTPEDPYPIWRGAGGPVTVAPLFLLYDYTCTDEYLLHPDSYPSRDAWCRARVAWTERRLAAVPETHRTVLVSHYPLVREPVSVLRHPEFAPWCGTELTADWHRRFRADAVVHGHLHIPRTTWYDGVGFEEVSVGYPGEWPPRRPRELLRPVSAALPGPAGAGASGGTGLLGQLLPGPVAVAEAFADAPESAVAGLHPQEAAVVSRGNRRRRREFTTVRLCAKRAIGALGIPPAPVLPDRRGAPQWPEDVVGSMTHCPGYRAAAVAPRSETAGIGIDAEPNEPLPDGLLEHLFPESDRTQVAAHSSARPGVCFDRLMFSAKEAVFKVVYPVTGCELTVDQTRIDLDLEASTFTARLLTAPVTLDGRRLGALTGRWLSRNGLLLTAVTLPR